MYIYIYIYIHDYCYNYYYYHHHSKHVRCKFIRTEDPLVSMLRGVSSREESNYAVLLSTVKTPIYYQNIYEKLQKYVFGQTPRESNYDQIVRQLGDLGLDPPRDLLERDYLGSKYDLGSSNEIISIVMFVLF